MTNLPVHIGFSVYMGSLLACNQTGSSVLVTKADTGFEDSTPVQDDTGTPEEQSVPVQPIYRTWTGARNIVFPELCQFSLSEQGTRITEETADTTHLDLLQTILAMCPNCQVYALNVLPETTQCGELGTLETGGLRYRVLAFQEAFEDGTLNLRNGPVELWHAIPPDWSLDFITIALHIGQTDQTSENQWSYSVENSFQAFRFIESSQFTLSEGQ